VAIGSGGWQAQFDYAALSLGEALPEGSVYGFWPRRVRGGDVQPSCKSRWPAQSCRVLDRREEQADGKGGAVRDRS
jgi:hypothetical protein